MPQSHHVARLGAPGDQRFYGVLNTAVAEVTQERVAGAQGQKPENRARTAQSLWKETVDDFVGSTVAADRDEVCGTASVRVSGNLACIAWGTSRSDFDVDSTSLQALQCRT
jgi:hypothetical protein